MRPLIPRIQPGDILKGTRNLRNYLQTAATLNYLNDISHGLVPTMKAKKGIYRPDKDEKFLVTVNAWGMFGACALNSDITLLFCNPKVPSRSPRARKDFVPMCVGPIRMDPTIFSKWFIKTSAKKTDLHQWSSYAYHMWVSLHLNMNSLGGDGGLVLRTPDGPTGPFTLHNHNVGAYSRKTLSTLVLQGVTRGITRPTAQSGRNMPGDGCGPQLKDTLQMREEIDRLCTNPRISQKLKAEAGFMHVPLFINK